MNPNYAPAPGTVKELKRQAKFLETIMKRADEKHEVTQEGRRKKVANLKTQIALAEEFENLEEAAK